MIKISVIIPVYNAEKYLRECLNSVCNQSLKEIEIICVDDGSTDSSLKILDEYKSRDNRFIILKQKNLYAGAARNAGAAIASGEYIHFLDADDFLVKDIYQKLYDLAKDNDLDILRTNAYVFDNETKKISETDYYSHKSLADNCFETVYKFLDRSKSMCKGVVAPWCGLIRREFIVKNKLKFNTLFCVNDRSFYFESLIKAKRIMYTNQYILYYRRNNNSSLIGKRIEHYECQIESYKLIAQISKSLPVSIRKNILNQELLDLYHWCLVFKKDPRWNVIKSDIREFVTKLDKSLWGENVTKENWYKRFAYLFKVDDLENRRSDYKYKISVIIPIYNSEKYLYQCLESLSNQLFRNAEFICVDDGSNDKSVDIVNEFKKNDERFKLFTQSHGYAGKARNLGVSYALGECIAFLDADDFYEPNYLAEMFAKYESSKAEVVICGVNLYDTEKNEKTKASFYLKKQYIPNDFKVFSPLDIKDVIFNLTPGNPWNKMFSHEFIKKYNIQFLPFRNSEDLYFVYLALALASKITYVDKALINYRIDNTSSLEHTKNDTPLLFYEAYKLLLEELKNKGLYKLFSNSLSSRFAEVLLYNLKGVDTFDSFNVIYQKAKLCALSEFNVLNSIDQNSELFIRMKDITLLSCENYLVKYYIFEQNESNYYKKMYSDSLKEIKSMRTSFNKKIKEKENESNILQKKYREQMTDYQNKYLQCNDELLQLKQSTVLKVGKTIMYLPCKIKDKYLIRKNSKKQ